MSNTEGRNVYITTTLPYVNADPHIGFATEIIRADIVARYERLRGSVVFFNTGTDEHGVKVWEKAQESGVPVEAYVDEYAAKFRNLKETLLLSDDLHFIRTTDPHHIAAAQEFWRRCKDRGYIYKKFYQIKYCKGCELEKTDSELVDGRCSIHPNMELEEREEENYFFMFSEFGPKLLSYYQENKSFVVPEFRKREITSFIERGLRDFSISRLKEKMPWGVPVPDDPEHVMYVWFDALVNYISTLGWPDDMKLFSQYWVEGKTIQYAGKDNLRQQAAMWQAMLLAADLPLTDQVVINGFINVNGQKMSKSLGNVINPYEVVEQYGAEALRYYVAREFHPFEDSDFSEEKFIQAYNANLANGLGNLSARILKMADMYFDGVISPAEQEVPIRRTLETASGVQEMDGWSLPYFIDHSIIPTYEAAFDTFELNRAADAAWQLIGVLDAYVTDYEPYKLIKTDKERTQAVIWNLVCGLDAVRTLVAPFLPETAEKLTRAITKQAAADGMVTYRCTLPANPLFERLETHE